MKKFLMIVLCLALMVSMFVGCGSSDKPAAQDTENTAAETTGEKV